MVWKFLARIAGEKCVNDVGFSPEGTNPPLAEAATQYGERDTIGVGFGAGTGERVLRHVAGRGGVER